ncbi:META domain-containing protein [Roseivirga sp. BDSF3-8]|uniref:META domain-containing protein n=1 Tax=Roseivirga sp. BDSF3-8 TaxID=3241598 RepID=UPI0035321A1D
MSEKNSGRLSVKDYIGEWEGLLPCADCDAVDYELRLDKNKTYRSTINYLGVGQSEPSVLTGKWEVSEDRIMIMDDAQQDTLLLMPEDGALIVLGPQGERMGGPEAKFFKLVRKAQAADQKASVESDYGFRAYSNTPAWNLEFIFDKFIRFYTPDGDTVAVPLPEVQTNGSSNLRYVSSGEGHSLDITILRDSCDLSEGSEPFTVEVIVDNEKTYRGCGTYVYDEAITGKWQMDKVNGETLKLTEAENKPVIVIGEWGMNISGNTGCNSFNGMLWVEGDRLRVNDISLTRKACPGDMESLFLDMMESRPTFTLEDGRLTLTGEDQIFELTKYENP